MTTGRWKTEPRMLREVFGAVTGVTHILFGGETEIWAPRADPGNGSTLGKQQDSPKLRISRY